MQEIQKRTKGVLDRLVLYYYDILDRITLLGKIISYLDISIKLTIYSYNTINKNCTL